MIFHCFENQIRYTGAVSYDCTNTLIPRSHCFVIGCNLKRCLGLRIISDPAYRITDILSALRSVHPGITQKFHPCIVLPGQLIIAYYNLTGCRYYISLSPRFCSNCCRPRSYCRYPAWRYCCYTFITAWPPDARCRISRTKHSFQILVTGSSAIAIYLICIQIQIRLWKFDRRRIYRYTVSSPHRKFKSICSILCLCHIIRLIRVITVLR